MQIAGGRSARGFCNGQIIVGAQAADKAFGPGFKQPCYDFFLAWIEDTAKPIIKMRFSDIEANAIQCYLLCRRRRLNLGPDALLSAGRLSCTDRHGDVLPCCDNVGAKFSMICGEEMFEVKKEEIGDLAMD